MTNLGVSIFIALELKAIVFQIFRPKKEVLSFLIFLYGLRGLPTHPVLPGMLGIVKGLVSPLD